MLSSCWLSTANDTSTVLAASSSAAAGDASAEGVSETSEPVALGAAAPPERERPLHGVAWCECEEWHDAAPLAGVGRSEGGGGICTSRRSSRVGASSCSSLSTLPSTPTVLARTAATLSDKRCTSSRQSACGMPSPCSPVGRAGVRGVRLTPCSGACGAPAASRSTAPAISTANVRADGLAVRAYLVRKPTYAALATGGRRTSRRASPAHSLSRARSCAGVPARPGGPRLRACHLPPSRPPSTAALRPRARQSRRTRAAR
jgi:hypothetical protein